MLKDALRQGPVWALGAMSGTSLDGVDAAMLLSDGIGIESFGASAYRAYGVQDRAVIAAALGRWPEQAGVAVAAQAVEAAHIEVLSEFEAPQVIGFHGQTLAHDPRGRGTHQAGDGARLAEALGVPVVWDFRSADVALGGEGAPLAPFFHFALAKYIKADAPVAFLNLGGVGNLTWVDPTADAPETPGALLAFDTGPANAPINDMMAARGLGEMDAGGALAARGTANKEVLEAFFAHPYFLRIPPKSLDRDAFSEVSRAVESLADADAAATLLGCAVASVARGLDHCPSVPSRVFVCGGGRKNSTMMAGLRAAMPCVVEPVEAVGLDGDMLEAQAFAYLAIRVARGLPTSCPSTTGVGANVGGGELSYPTGAPR
ncbi:MAG: anhydro-N-acetylmuramic acid kinase [Maritimibacter sp.]